VKNVPLIYREGWVGDEKDENEKASWVIPSCRSVDLTGPELTAVRVTRGGGGAERPQVMNAVK